MSESEAATLRHGDAVDTDTEWNQVGANGWSTYILPDGVVVAVDPAAPLPVSVTLDIQHRLDEIGRDPDSPYGSDSAAYSVTQENRHAMNALLDAVAGIGKRVVLVRPTAVGYANAEIPGSINSVRWVAWEAPDRHLEVPYAAPLPDGTTWSGWGATDSDKAEFLRRIIDWSSAQPDAATWLVFVAKA